MAIAGVSYKVVGERGEAESTALYVLLESFVFAF
jgi:hypothetical protein